MKRIFIIGILPFLIGVVGAYLRAHELIFVIDEVTGLPSSGSSVTAVLGGLSILLAVSLLICSFVAYKKESTVPDTAKNSLGVPVSAVLSAVLLFAYGGYKLYICAADFEVTSLIYGFLTVYCAASILIIGLMRLENRDNALYAVFAVVPVFWACFSLILLFRERISDPIILDYIYLLFAYISILLFAYAVSAFVFGKNRLVIAFLSGGIGVYLCTIELFAWFFATRLDPGYAIGLIEYVEKLPLLAFIISAPLMLSHMYKNKHQVN